ncbi:MAG: hypothetical protein U1E65_15200 [Myxococcota bacterium]
MWRRSLIGLWPALLLGCGVKHYTAAETWKDPPAFRIVILRHGEEERAFGRAGTAPLELDLADNSLSGAGTEVWTFSWNKAQLELDYPGLVGASAEAVEAALQPTMDESQGEVAPAPSEVLFASLDDRASLAIDYAHKTAQEAQLASIRPRLIVDPRAYCGTVQITRFASSPGRHLDGVVAPDEDHPLFFESKRPYSSSSSVSLVRWEGDHFTRLGAVATGSVSAKLAYDPKTQSIWTVQNRRILHLDLLSNPLPVPDFQGGPPYVTDVACGNEGDGSVMALIGVTSPSNFFVFSPYLLDPIMGWVSAMKNGQIQDYRFEILDVANARRAAAWYLCWVAAYQDPVEDTGWHNEFVDFGCNALNRRATVRDLSGYKDQYVVVGDGGTVSFRNAEARVWPQATDPASGSLGVGYPSLHVAAALDGRQALVAGDNGFVAFHNHTAWCPIDIGARTTVFRGAIAPSREVVFLLVEGGNGQPTTVVRLQLPPSR